jgi:hypothetical protein
MLLVTCTSVPTIIAIYNFYNFCLLKNQVRIGLFSCAVHIMIVL